MDEKTENITLQFRTQSLETLIILKIIERKYIGRLVRNDLKQRYFFYAEKINRKKMQHNFSLHCVVSEIDWLPIFSNLQQEKNRNNLENFFIPENVCSFNLV